MDSNVYITGLVNDNEDEYEGTSNAGNVATGVYQVSVSGTGDLVNRFQLNNKLMSFDIFKIFTRIYGSYITKVFIDFAKLSQILHFFIRVL